MEPKVITLTMFKDYPYSLVKDFDNLKVIVQVKHTLDFSSEPRSLMKQKIRSLQNITLKHLAKLLSFQQEENKVNLFFEYIPRRLDTVLWNVKLTYIQEVEHNLLLLAQNLAYHYVVHEFKIQNVGLDQNNQLKYFLGFAFKIDKMINKQETASRYFKVIKAFFAEGGKLHRVQSPSKPSRYEYYETVDSESCKTNEFNLSPHLLLPQVEGKAAMKKSATACDNTDEEMKNHFNLEIVKRLSLNTFNKDMSKEPIFREFQISIVAPKQEREMLKSGNISGQLPENRAVKPPKTNHNSNNNKQMKMIKVEEIAARINKFKNIMKEATGRVSFGNAAASHPIVKIDGTNNDDRVCQENKLMFTTSSSTMQKKIAEYKETKLSRPYGEILNNNYNQGLQVPVNGKKENNVISFNTSSSSKVIQGVMEANTPKTKQFNKLFPSHMLRQKSQVEPKKTQRNSVDTSKIRQQAPRRLQNAQFRQYKKMARNDKYCEQFMQFLDDDKASTKKSERKRPIDKLINQMIIEESKEEEKTPKDADDPSDIQNRVKLAIRNSLKLINGLKQRDNQVPQS